MKIFGRKIADEHFLVRFGCMSNEINIIKQFFLAFCFGLSQLYFIQSHYGGFYKPTILKVHHPIFKVAIDVPTIMPGELSTSFEWLIGVRSRGFEPMTFHVIPLPSIKHIFSNLFKEFKQNKKEEEQKLKKSVTMILNP